MIMANFFSQVFNFRIFQKILITYNQLILKFVSFFYFVVSGLQDPYLLKGGIVLISLWYYSGSNNILNTWKQNIIH